MRDPSSGTEPLTGKQALTIVSGVLLHMRTNTVTCYAKEICTTLLMWETFLLLVLPVVLIANVLVSAMQKRFV